MSREILFRGKSKYSGEWVYGIVYCKQTAWEREKTAYYNGMFITTGIHYISGKAGENEELEEYEVIPETVGQYTGLTDKNGKKIFEGDIVKLTDTKAKIEWYAIIEFGNPNGNYDWGWQLKPVKKFAVNTDILCWIDMEEIGAYCEIIGNIYDNPELLKENDND